MKIEGTYRIMAPRQSVWAALQDAEVLRRILPGCQQLQAAGDGRYQATFRAGVGAIKGAFSGEIQISDLDQPNAYTLRSLLKSSVGSMEGNGRVTLSDPAAELRTQPAALAGEAAAGAFIGPTTSSPVFADSDVAAPDVAAQAATAPAPVAPAVPQTLVSYSGEVHVGGLLASIAPRLIESAARKNMDEMFANLAHTMRTPA